MRANIALGFGIVILQSKVAVQLRPERGNLGVHDLLCALLGVGLAPLCLEALDILPIGVLANVPGLVIVERVEDAEKVPSNFTDGLVLQGILLTGKGGLGETLLAVVGILKGKQVLCKAVRVAAEISAAHCLASSSNTVPMTSLYAPPSSISNQHSVSMLGFGPLKWTI